MIKIATDSTCDLPPGFFEDYDITVVPINIQFGTDSYEEGITIDRETFVRKIDEMGILPTTSQPSAGQFEQYYDKLREEGATDIISIHITAKLSGTYQSAVLAQEMMEGRVRVHPFDSTFGSIALGFMTMEASRMGRAGKSVAEILSRMEQIRDRGHLLLTLKDLRYAQMSGRTGRLQSSLASLLSIKPIVLLEDGLLDVIEQVRTQGRAIDRLIDIVAERVGRSEPVNLAAVHAMAPEGGQALLEKAKGIFNCQETFMTDLTSSLVVHLGPGTLGLFAYRV
jgi:DegV family protein with EDD domain